MEDAAEQRSLAEHASKRGSLRRARDGTVEAELLEDTRLRQAQIAERQRALAQRPFEAAIQRRDTLSPHSRHLGSVRRGRSQRGCVAARVEHHPGCV
jgi:hypothetical protein